LTAYSLFSADDECFFRAGGCVNFRVGFIKHERHVHIIKREISFEALAFQPFFGWQP
jgi:hypothetical protein